MSLIVNEDIDGFYEMPEAGEEVHIGEFMDTMIDRGDVIAREQARAIFDDWTRAGVVITNIMPILWTVDTSTDIPTWRKDMAEIKTILSRII